MKFYYVNHLNQRINLYGFPYFVVDTDLIDYEWKYEASANEIKEIYKEITTKSLKIGIHPKNNSDTQEEFIKAMNEITSIFEIDVIENQAGRLYTDDGYYLPCFITESKKTNWNRASNFIYSTFMVAPNNALFWIKETKTSFIPLDEPLLYNNDNKLNLGYPYGYPFDYRSNLVPQSITNDSYTAQNFEMTIYGYAEAPTINIAGHSYGLSSVIEKDEYVKINSVTKKITKYKKDGTIDNLFSERDRDSYIFDKIPTGMSSVTWIGSFGFDIVIFDERSEPAWSI